MALILIRLTNVFVFFLNNRSKGRFCAFCGIYNFYATVTHVNNYHYIFFYLCVLSSFCRVWHAVFTFDKSKFFRLYFIIIKIIIKIVANNITLPYLCYIVNQLKKMTMTTDLTTTTPPTALVFPIRYLSIMRVICAKEKIDLDLTAADTQGQIKGVLTDAHTGRPLSAIQLFNLGMCYAEELIKQRKND